MNFAVCVQEIREFKNLAGKKIITLIQVRRRLLDKWLRHESSCVAGTVLPVLPPNSMTAIAFTWFPHDACHSVAGTEDKRCGGVLTPGQVSEVAAGPGKSKKAGAPVDNEEFYKVIDAVEYPGDAERLLRHLDPGSFGYANTRTLRILNEQRNEEKAVPQFLKKFAENRQAILEQKIASVVIPPAKELLAKQDSLRENCLNEHHTKKETQNAKEHFLRQLTSKFGSNSPSRLVRRAWLLHCCCDFSSLKHDAEKWAVPKGWDSTDMELVSANWRQTVEKRCLWYRDKKSME